jgi:hypothetical protein
MLTLLLSGTAILPPAAHRSRSPPPSIPPFLLLRFFPGDTIVLVIYIDNLPGEVQSFDC